MNCIAHRVYLGILLGAVAFAAVAQDEWQIEIDGQSENISTDVDGNRVMADAERLAAALGATVVKDDGQRVLRITSLGNMAFAEPATEGRVYTIDPGGRQPYTFTYLGYEMHEGQCLESSDGRTIDRCAGDEVPVPMTMLRFRIGNPGTRPLNLNRALVDFYVSNTAGITRDELNFWMHTETRTTALGKLLPGDDIELLAVVDIADDPPIASVVAELRGDHVLEFGVAGTPPRQEETRRGRAVGTGDIQLDVNITGFTVNNATWDHALNADGCGDEVWFNVILQRMGPDGVAGPRREERSRVIGDRSGYEDRIKAGTGACFSLIPPDGGLQTRDDIDIKMPLFSGPLPDGEVLVITPSIWEWDGSNHSVISFLEHVKNGYQDVVEFYETSLNAVIGQSSDLINPVARVNFTEMVPMMLDPETGKLPLQVVAEELLNAIDNAVGESKDRPIGMYRDGEHFAYDPTVLVIKGESLTDGYSDSITIRYRDDAELRGDYTLRLSVSASSPQ